MRPNLNSYSKEKFANMPRFLRQVVALGYGIIWGGGGENYGTFKGCSQNIFWQDNRA